MTAMNRREFGMAALGALAVGVAPAGVAGQGGMLRSYRYVHLDVFTDTRLQGNQLFVYVDPVGLDTDRMLTLTRESNLSENTFVFPPEQPGTDYRVRIFTRAAETPFAGHPTIGTAFALAHTGALKPGQPRTTFGLGVGPTNLDLEWKNGVLAFAWMTQQKPTFGKTIADAAALAAAIGVDPGQSTGARPRRKSIPDPPSSSCLSRRARRSMRPCSTARRSTPCSPLPASSGAVCTSSRPSAGRTMRRHTAGCSAAPARSRIPPRDPPPGPAGAFMAAHGFAPGSGAASIVFLQGVLARRPSRLFVRVGRAGGDVADVKVGGSAAVVGEGTMIP